MSFCVSPSIQAAAWSPSIERASCVFIAVSQGKTLRKEACQIDLLLRTKKSLYVVEIKFRSRIDHSSITDVQEKIRKLKLPKGTPCRTVLVYQGEPDPGIADEDYFDYLVPFERMFKEG